MLVNPDCIRLELDSLSDLQNSGSRHQAGGRMRTTLINYPGTVDGSL